MTVLTWNPARAVGVRAMDNQHGVLMDAMNDLRWAALQGTGHEQVSAMLDHLIEFLRMHFTSEERLMEKCGSPGVAAHQAKHQSIMAQILQSSHRFQYGDGVDISALPSLLKVGYDGPIESFDHPYGEWLNDRGIY